MSKIISEFDRKVDVVAKTVFIGESAVGKSSMALRITKDTFINYMESTVGAAFLLKYIKYNNKTFKLEIWDTAGQERYHCLVPMYYRHAKIAFVVYDITDLKSFIRAKDWICELDAKGPKDIIIMLIGNKIDEKENRKVDPAMVYNYIKEKKYIHFEVSAKTGEGIKELLDGVCAKLLDPEYISTQPIVTESYTVYTHTDITTPDNTLEKKSYCCGYF